MLNPYKWWLIPQLIPYNQIPHIFLDKIQLIN
jgi:hypothetical protein